MDVDRDQLFPFRYLWGSVGIESKRRGILLDLFTPGPLK